MSAGSHKAHVPPTAPGAAAEVIAQLRSGCVECAMELLTMPTPAEQLIEFARAAHADAPLGCPDDDALRALVAFTLPMARAIDIAVHAAHCERCAACVRDAAFAGDALAAETAAAQRAHQIAVERLHHALRPEARRRAALRVVMLVPVAAAACVLAWFFWSSAAQPPKVSPEVRVAVSHDAALPSTSGLLPRDLHCTAGTTRTCPVPGQRGPCSVGLRRCEAGSWSACEATTYATPERCDNRLDDDCDGDIDEGCSCRGDLTDLLAPGDQSTLASAQEVEFRWAPSSCPARALLLRVRDLDTGELVVDDVAVSGTSWRVVLLTPAFVVGHHYRWAVRVVAPGAPSDEYAAQFRTFVVQ